MIRFGRAGALVVTGLVLCLCFAISPAQADHATPERVVEDKYVVSLWPTFAGDTAQVRLFFRDLHTGKNLLVPIQYQIEVIQDDTTVFTGKESTDQGVGELSIQLPGAGIYKFRMEFEVSGDENAVYRPSEWSIWAPGAGGRERYPITYSELSGFFLLSVPMLSSRIFFTSRVETSSPVSVESDSEKNVFNKNVPKCVCTYLLLATRETVEISIATISAMSFKIIGRRSVSSPEIK